jgi:hypothetical protein
MGNKTLLQTLQYAAGLFEVVWDFDHDILDSDQTEEYEDTIQQIREITGVFSRNTYIEEIKDSREELPFERNPDDDRDFKYGR